MIRYNGREVQFQILWVQLCGEAVADAIARPGRYFDIVPRCRQVSNILRTVGAEDICPEAAANENDVDRLWLVVREGEERRRRVSIYQFYSEDLGLRERG